jgi:putative glycosyltransferase (exosortase G-associated)
MGIINRLLNSVVFWAAWIIIPIIMEIIPSVGSVVVLLKRHYRQRKDYKKPTVYPEISLIVPVYNSEQTLFGCIKSIVDSDYPTDRIRVFLVNNQGKDDSFSVYAECQKKFPNLAMQWLNSQQGKSKALNLALYNSTGKYIINLDSDGMLEKSALTNMVDKFEADMELNCMTGAILTTPEQIEEYKGFFPKLLRKLEFMEYAQAFLAGRSYASELDNVYTLSGAFSAFRKSAVLKSQMYNTDTICEDTQITFQMKYVYKERVEVCEDAIYFVDPIEGVNKLYTQRQRWQRGSLEVAKMFSSEKFRLTRIFKDINIKTLLYDHTFAFPRMIWYLALICLLCLHYSGRAIVLATVMIFAMYIVIGYLYFFSTEFFLRGTPELRKYYSRQWWVVLLLPAFNFIVFFIRVAGIINSINTDSAWKTRDLTDEGKAFRQVVKEDAGFFLGKLRKLKNLVNKEKKQKTKKEKESKKSIGWVVCVGLLYLISVFVIVVCHWIYKTYGVGLNELITTFTLSVKGASSDVVLTALKNCLPPIILGIGVFIFLLLFSRKKERKIIQNILSAGAVLFVFGAAFYVNRCFDAVGYFQTSVAQSSIYEDYYVNPNDVAITANGSTKNLVYIYLESMETTYASMDVGGAQRVNYIPNLTQLAEENVSFSNSDKLGGFHSTNGTGITMGALFGTTSGIPFNLTSEVNDMISQGNFASGVTNLGDVLQSKGYTQEFLCGSDGDFGGRKTYFQQHGDYNVFDLYTAREKGYIDDDYFVWWGFEDKILFQIAKDELTRMAAEGEPFNFTMLTVDAHHIDGYLCDLCGDEYENVTANVVACTDKQVGEFIQWCKEQDFYENTVFVITGDHPRMDTSLVEGNSYFDRTVYNCIINGSNTGEVNDKNRIFTPMDMLPTVLSSMGFSIEGERLGLGTNLFSDTKTLAELKGFDWLDTELSKTSQYYYHTFVPELGS